MQFWKSTLATLSVATAITCVTAMALANGHHHCCPKCGAPQECCYKEIKVARCKKVPETKPVKKTVYEVKMVPYCSHDIHSCDECGKCTECEACPRYKRQLVKKEITCGEKTTTKCVVEECVELVPCACTRCGHCGHCGAGQ